MIHTINYFKIVIITNKKNLIFNSNISNYKNVRTNLDINATYYTMLTNIL